MRLAGLSRVTVLRAGLMVLDHSLGAVCVLRVPLACTKDVYDV